MDRHRVEKRRKAPRSSMRSVWVPAFTAIFVLYMVFVVKVNYYATTTATTANGVGAAAFNAGAQGKPAAPAREMQEKGGAAPMPALATQPAAPLRMETKPPPRQADPLVGAITKGPPPTVAPQQAAPPAVQPVVTATPPQSQPIVVKPSTTKPPTTAPVQPVILETAKPIDAPVIEQAQAAETAKPVEAPVINDPTQAPVTNAAAPLVQTSQPPAANAPVYDEKDPLGDRHQTLSGYQEIADYLATYKPTDGESLFLYFACSDDQFNAHDWSSECTEASKKIYDTFGKSPSTNRLVTIYAGSENFWNYQNKFRNDRDLRVKTVPSIMKWHGNGGETSGMMITDTLLDEPFLRYLFKNKDQPDVFLNAAAMVETKTIETVSSYEAYQAKLVEYKLEAKPRHPLYLMFVSGRIAENNRPWCPYCRFSELPLEYGFYAFAPPNARLLRVEVAQTYQQWKTPNKYNHDLSLGPLRGVPAFFTVQELANKELKFDRIYERFDRIATLRNLFSTAARVHDE